MTLMRVAGIVRNRWPACPGMGGRLRPESPAGIERNTQISIDINRKGNYPKDIKYPFYELVRDGIVKAEGIEKISIEKDDTGKVIRVYLKSLNSV